MSRVLGSWIEVTIPTGRMPDTAVSDALARCVKVVGGATVTPACGFYIRDDNGQLDREQVSIVRWDFNTELSIAVIGAADGVVSALLAAGEESVLRRRYFSARGSCHGPIQIGYQSELIFA